MNRRLANRAGRRSHRAATGVILALALAALPAAPADAQTRLQTGTLACSGEGGWGAIITSKKDFRCAFTSSDGAVREEYSGQIRKYGIDIGKTGQTALTVAGLRTGRKNRRRLCSGIAGRRIWRRRRRCGPRHGAGRQRADWRRPQLFRAAAGQRPGADGAQHRRRRADARPAICRSAELTASPAPPSFRPALFVR